MLRYVATKMAHARNPYPPGSSSWGHWNAGYIETAIPRTPTRWELIWLVLMIAPPLLIGFAATIIIFYSVR